jgi:hypothetical protein
MEHKSDSSSNKGQEGDLTAVVKAGMDFVVQTVVLWVLRRNMLPPFSGSSSKTFIITPRLHDVRAQINNRKITITRTNLIHQRQETNEGLAATSLSGRRH